MLALIFTTLFFIVVSSLYIINADSKSCQVVFRNGNFIGFIGNVQEYPHTEQQIHTPNNKEQTKSRDCTKLKMIENGTQLNWYAIDRVQYPNLTELSISLTRHNFRAKDFDWELLLGICNGVDFSVSVNNVQVVRFSWPNKDSDCMRGFFDHRLEIDSIDTMPVLDAFQSQEIPVKTLSIRNSQFEDKKEFIPPKGTTTILFDNVRILNFPGLIQNMKSLEVLKIVHNVETIDLSGILSASDTIKSIDITGTNSFTVTASKNTTHQTTSLTNLRLRDCVLDSSFKNSNIWKVMPNVSELDLSLNLDEIDLGDIASLEHLKSLDLSNGSFTFTKPVQRQNDLNKLQLSWFDLDTKYADIVWRTFPNLKHLNIYGPSRPSMFKEEFLTGVLKNLPDIEEITVEPYQQIKGFKKGQFKLTYTYNSNTIDCNSTEVKNINTCKAHFQNGELKIIPDGWKSIDALETCNELEIKGDDENSLNWEEIKRVALLPNLQSVSLYLSTDNFKPGEFQWSTFLSLVSSSKHELEWLGFNYFLYVNGVQVFKYEVHLRKMLIAFIDPYPVLKYIEPDTVLLLTLQNVQVKNISNFLGRFKSLYELTLNHFENVDIGDVLKYSTDVKSLVISKANLTCRDSTVISNSLRFLKLHHCVQTPSFKENSGKVMPNLTSLHFSSMFEKIDISDLLGYDNLDTIHITNASLTFTNSVHQFNSLRNLELKNCKFDSKFSDLAWSAFTNLSTLSVDSRLGGTKPTQEFLNGALAKLNGIRYIELSSMDYLPSFQQKGSFEVLYTSNR